MIALIDGDILVYECGFSSDANAKKDNLPDGHEPIEYTLKIVKNKIAEILEVVEADSYEIYLTGSSNYRMDFLPDYKANRDPDHKPYWYKEIKEYLINKYKAIVCEGEEADDRLGIRQSTEQDDHTCICSKDKDLDCIHGLHYNWSPSKVDKGVYNVTKEEALRFFYTQCLTGDATDNIPGFKKLTGKVATKKKKDVLQTLTTEKEMYDYVNSLYDGVDWHNAAKCLWIRQSPDQIWGPPVG